MSEKSIDQDDEARRELRREIFDLIADEETRDKLLKETLEEMVALPGKA